MEWLVVRELFFRRAAPRSRGWRATAVGSASDTRSHPNREETSAAFTPPSKIRTAITTRNQYKTMRITEKRQGLVQL
jgi:hypothetical protein